MMINFKLQRDPEDPQGPASWNFSKADWGLFSCRCSNEVKEGIVDSDIDSLNRNIVPTMNSIAGDTLPTYRSSVGKKIKVPWWDEGCKQAIQERRAALKRLRRTLRLEDVVEYKRKRAYAQRTIKQAKTASWKLLCSSINSWCVPRLE